MADKTLKTRIKLKYDTLTNWQGAGASVVLLKGEVAVCEIPTGSTAEQTTPPAVLFKVGDGVKTFAQLPWVSGLAADVYAWAKAPNKPTYTHTEVGAAAASHTHTTANITDFTATVNGLIDAKIEEIPSVTVPEYTLESGTADGSIVLKKDGAVVGADVLVKGWAALKATADSALQKADIASGSANGTISVDGTDVAVKGLGSAAYTDSGAYAAADHNHEIADVTGLQGALNAKASLSGAAFTGAVTVQAPTAETNPATKKYVDDAISAAATGEFVVVEDLPGTGDAGKIYLKAHAHGEGDAYDEYIYTNNAWEKIGNTDIDLSEYAKKTEVDSAIDGKIAALNLGDLATKDTVTESEISGTISAAKISGLGDLATKNEASLNLKALAHKDTISDADVAEGAAIKVSKISGLGALATKDTVEQSEVNGLTAALNGKVPTTRTIAGIDLADNVTATELAAAVKGELEIPQGTVTSVAAGTGLKVTGNATVTPTIELDESTVFVFDCGSSTVNVGEE